jgi:ABC-type lipoprotein release transport system permease subunit
VEREEGMRFSPVRLTLKPLSIILILLGICGIISGIILGFNLSSYFNNANPLVKKLIILPLNLGDNAALDTKWQNLKTWSVYDRWFSSFCSFFIGFALIMAGIHMLKFEI